MGSAIRLSWILSRLDPRCICAGRERFVEKDRRPEPRCTQADTFPAAEFLLAIPHSGRDTSLVQYAQERVRRARGFRVSQEIIYCKILSYGCHMFAKGHVVELESTFAYEQPPRVSARQDVVRVEAEP